MPPRTLSATAPILVTASTGPWRRPLSAWSEEVVSILKAQPAPPRSLGESCCELTNSLNLAALLAHHWGARATAAAFCRIHVRTLLHVLVESVDPELTRLVVQPCINYWRTRTTPAVCPYRGSYGAWLRDPKAVASFAFGQRDLAALIRHAIETDEHSASMIASAYAVDMAKWLVRTRDWASAATFAREATRCDRAPLPLSRNAVAACDELAIVAQLHGGDPASARDQCARTLSKADGFESALRLNYDAQCAESSGDRRTSRSHLEQLAERSAEMRVAAPTPASLLLLCRAASYAAAQRWSSIARSIATVAHSLARRVDDEVLSMSSLHVLVDVATDEQRAEYLAAYRIARLSCGYACLSLGARAHPMSGTGRRAVGLLRHAAVHAMRGFTSSIGLVK